MELTKVRLDRDKLLALSEDEYTFFVALGHHSNEVNAITKLIYWSADNEDGGGPEGDGRHTILQILLRLLAGKLHEGWRLFEKAFFGPGLSKTYDPKLDTESSQALGELKRYFGAKNAAEVIRNGFAFHHSPSQVAAVLPTVSDPLLLYMDGKSAPNTFFYFSEVLMDQAIINALDDEGIQRDFEELVSEFFKVSLWFAQAADGVMNAIIEESGQELRAEDPEQVVIVDPPEFGEIAIPWFADVTRTVKRTQGSA